MSNCEIFAVKQIKWNINSEIIYSEIVYSETRQSASSSCIKRVHKEKKIVENVFLLKYYPRKQEAVVEYLHIHKQTHNILNYFLILIQGLKLICCNQKWQQYSATPPNPKNGEKLKLRRMNIMYKLFTKQTF